MSESRGRRLPDGLWWLAITAAYSWGYSEGKSAGYLQALGTMLKAVREELER